MDTYTGIIPQVYLSTTVRLLVLLKNVLGKKYR